VLLTVLSFLIIFFFTKSLFKYFADVYIIKVLQWFIKNIRLNHLKGLNQLSYTFFVKSDIGHIQNTLTTEVDRSSTAFKSYFKAIQYIVMVVVYAGFAFFVDWKFAILVSIGGGLSNFLFKKIYSNTKAASKRLSGGNSIFQGLMIQEISNYKYLKATGTLSRYAAKLKSAVYYIEKTNVTIGKLNSIMNAAREPVLITVIAVVIYIQTTFLGSNLGPILISLLFFYRALTFLMQMQVEYNKFLSVSGSLENTRYFESELHQHKAKLGKNNLIDKINSLELQNAKFSYEDNQVLRGINLSLKKNQTLAFVGESGSGKTTLVNILTGLLPLDEGNYLINGQKAQSLNITNFQQRIGYITQDPVIFSDSVFNNVTFWDEKNAKNIAKFEKALAQASVKDYINTLPEKEDEILGNNGINLSGGQRQRISIARELYKDVEILILDEATSALDSETERAIQENIDNLKGEYTILIIAHRIATIKNADKIFLMEDGNIKNSGDFNELTETSTYFKRLVELQEL